MSFGFDAKFVGKGIRPPGVFYMSFNGTEVKMNTCVYIVSS